MMKINLILTESNIIEQTYTLEDMHIGCIRYKFVEVKLKRKTKIVIRSFAVKSFIKITSKLTKIT